MIQSRQDLGAGVDRRRIDLLGWHQQNHHQRFDGNKLIGVAIKAAANPSSIGAVRLNGMFNMLIRPGRLASLRNEVCHLRQSLFKLVIACVLTLSIMCLALRMKGEW